MQVTFDLQDRDSYRQFLAAKSIPCVRFFGRNAEFPDEYASMLGVKPKRKAGKPFTPSPWMYDYQKAIAEIAVAKQKYAVFADCGLGKTLILLDYVRHASKQIGKRRALIVCPLMVVRQTIAECKRFYGDSMQIEQVRAAGLQSWIDDKTPAIGITNYDAMTQELRQGNLGCLILDESSMLKSHYGKWGQRCLELGDGLDWKLCLTGTPAPNDRIEYANHAVFLDQFPTVNAFLARYFINRGQTDNRWELKPHALRPFYQSLAHWSIFVSDPSVYGWHDLEAKIPPLNIHIHDVPMTEEQHDAATSLCKSLFVDPGSFVRRGKLTQIAKGIAADGGNIPTVKYDYLNNLIASWPDEQTIVWCHYNREQDELEKMWPNAASVRGDTPEHKREDAIDGFQSGKYRILISKPRVLGFGLNLQAATRQVFSSMTDSYEEYYQAVKRSSRIGSKYPLNVHIPITEVERATVDNVLRKSSRVVADTNEQEALFREVFNAKVS